MPKVLSGPKPPSLKGGGRRNFRLSPLEIGVAILVAMGGIYLIYILLGGLFGGGDSPPPPGPGVGPGISPARLDKVLSAAETAQRRLTDLDKRLVELDKRLSQTAQGGAAPAGKGGGDPRLAARLAGLEKQVAAWGGKVPAAGKDKGDPRLAARLEGLEKQVAALEKQGKQAAQAKDKDADKLAARLAGLEKQVAGLEKQGKQAAQAKDKNADKLAARLDGLENQLKALEKTKAGQAAQEQAKLDQRLTGLEKQLKALAQRPVAAGDSKAAASQLALRVAGQGEVLSGLTSNLGKLERQQQSRDRKLAELEKRLAAVGRPPAGAAPDTAKLNQRLDRLEKRMAGLGQGERQDDKGLANRLAILEKQTRALAQADRQGDRSAAARLTALENDLARVRREAAAGRKTDPKLAARLASLEKKLDIEDHQGQVLDQRLDRLEQRMGSVAARPAPRPAARPAAPVAPAPPKPARIVHTVRPGQTLFGLSRTYGVRMAQIKDWNPRLGSRDKLYIGEKLIIYVQK